MASPAPSATGAHTYTINGLAQMRIYHGMPASEISQICISQKAVAESLAMVIDQQAAYLQAIMAATTAGGWDKYQAGRKARKALRPMRQAAERIRAGGASSLAAWRTIVREFGALMMPQNARQRGPNWTK